MKYFKIILFLSFASLFPLQFAYSEEKAPTACNCDSPLFTGEDEGSGCTAEVKRQACAQARQMEMFREIQRQQEQARRYESYRATARVTGSGKPVK